jgi:hypothetical protein
MTCLVPEVALVHDRFLSAFDVSVETRKGSAECTYCGKDLSEFVKKGDIVQCPEFFALGTKRLERVVEGAAPLHPQPREQVESGRNDIASESSAFISAANVTLLATRILPTGPLPATVRTFAGAKTAMSLLIREAMALELEPPIVAVRFSRSKSFPWTSSTDPGVLRICGAQTIETVDLRRLAGLRDALGAIAESTTDLLAVRSFATARASGRVLDAKAVGKFEEILERYSLDDRGLRVASSLTGSDIRFLNPN